MATTSTNYKTTIIAIVGYEIDRARCKKIKAMAKRRKNQDELNAQQRERALTNHMWRLECFSVRQYFDWCEQRGFRADTRKSALNLRQELAYYQRQDADMHLRRSRVARNPADAIRAFCEGDLELDDINSVSLREVCHRIHRASLALKERRSLHRFLAAVLEISKLPLQSETQNQQQQHYIDTLIGLHRVRRHWIRGVDLWRPRTHNRHKQFRSLLRHLLAAYDVPEFLDSVWFRTDKRAINYQKWYVDIGSGKSAREGPTPVPMTRKMAHYFLQAPKHYSVEQAVRFGQIKSFGGSVGLCNAVVESRLGAGFANDEFWQSVMRFFVRNANMDLSQVGPIVDFLQQHKFESEEVFLENGEGRVLPPPQPNLSMKKRTLDALLLQVEQWHQRLGEMKVDIGMRWAPSGIRPAGYMRGKDDKRVIWRIRELLSQKELVQEGKALKHCVASYSRHCRNGVSSIWSMTSEDASGNLRRRQTIEVSRHKRIVQCRGRMNKLPSDLEQKIVARWAKAESLSINLHGY